MSDLDIEIKLDPNAAVTGARAVAGEVAKTEAAAAKAQTTCKNLSEVFKRIGSDQQRAAAEASKLRGQIGSLATNFQQLANQMRADMMKPVANGFAQVAQAIQLEKNALVSIRGDLDEYKTQVQAIDALHQKGIISAKEHGDAIEAAGKRTGVVKAPSSSLGQEVGNTAGAQLAGMIGPAAIVGAGIGAITQGAEEFRKMRDEVVEATNHLVKFYGSFDEASSHVGQFTKLSTDLRESLGDSVRAYDAVEGASQKLYLTQQQQINITKNLGQLMKEDGDSIQNVVPVMERLEAAIDRNQISGGELAKVMKQYPELADVWKQEFGATRSELIKFADNGKLVEMGLGRLVTSLEPATDATKKFGTMHITAREAEALHLTAFEQLRASYGDSIEDLRGVTEAGDNWAESLARQGLQGKKVSDQIDKINEGMQGQIALQQILTGLAMSKQQTDAWGLVHQLSGQDDARALDQKRQKLVMLRDEIEKSPLTTGFTQFDKSLQLDEVDRAMENLTGGMKDMSSVIDAQKKKWEELLDARLAWEKVETRNMAVKNFTVSPFKGADFGQFGVGSTTLPSEQTAKNAKAGIMGDALEDPGYTPESRAEAMKKLTENTKKWNEELGKTSEVSKAIEGAFENAATTLGDNLVDAANGADVSWSKTFSGIITGFEKAIAQALILEAIGSAGKGGVADGTGLLGALGFATGGDMMAGSSGAMRRYPGAATGMDALVPGAGGTDGTFVGLRVTPGESIHVRTPAQREAAAQAGGGGAAPVTIINSHDPRAITAAMSGPDGGRVIFNHIRTMLPAIKALIGAR
jgi:tape measure domain-containing protein